MISAKDFQINGTTFGFKSDNYPISKIKNVRVKKNTFKDHALRVIFMGLIMSSIVWIICPEDFGFWSGPLALFIGGVSAILTIKKYELQVEFDHNDETGLQWISIAKTNQQQVRALFDIQAENIHQRITRLAT